jgi:tRNA dimethylallyltransferase
VVTASTPAEAPIIALVGPTATGKTEVGIRLAEALDGEIISADSQAVYRGMDIGTAKPTTEERTRILFHLLDVADPDDRFTVARFVELAEVTLSDIRERQKQPLLVGGTGLYVKALLEGFGLTSTPADLDLRARLDAESAAHGAPALHRRLAEVDPAAASKIHPNDRIRIVRALEVFERTGEPMSAQHARDADIRVRRPSIRFGLTAPREELNERIDRRVDSMVLRGLVEEVQELLRRGYTSRNPPLRSLGYNEICGVLAGETTLTAAIEEIKRNTRRFAKRQLTWFRADPEIHWIDVMHKSGEQVADEILFHLKAPREGLVNS